MVPLTMSSKLPPIHTTIEPFIHPHANFNNFFSSKYPTICLTASSTLVFSLSIKISGFSGFSYGALIPVNSLISPALAFLYRPLGSRASAASTEISTRTSMKGRGSSSGLAVGAACSERATSRSALYGEMKDVIAMVELSAKSLATYSHTSSAHCFFSTSRMPMVLDSAAYCVLTPRPSAMRPKSALTSAIRLMFSLRSFSEKPRSLFSPKRTLSPSKRYAARPRWRRCCSRAVAMVDLPEAERPVNQIVKPRCLRFVLRSLRERDGCQVMLLFGSN